jgi:hypothetical protein
MRAGDLAWLPTGVALLKFDGKSGTIQEWCYPKSPKYVFISGDTSEIYYEILYNGEKWAIPKHELYE